MSGPAHLIDDCFLHDKDRLRHEEALALLRARLTTIVGTQTVEAGEALGRVLAQDLTAPHAVPLHTNAAVDGYAFRHADLVDTPLPVSGRIPAGHLDPAALPPGTAARIFTGAPMPPGADSVAMQEDCVLQNDSVVLPTGLKKGANCRLAGEDLSLGDTVLETGTRLQAADLAAAASMGAAQLSVFTPLRIALFSNGDEMRVPQEDGPPLRVGEVYDANAPMLRALLSALPVVVTHGGIIRDTAEAAQTAITQASRDHDVIITTGGASRGDEDHMLTVLDRLGSRHLWQLAVKPGRPMMFGQLAGTSGPCLLFGLPGNPVAAMVCFLLYARPALLRLAGAQFETPQRFPLPAQFTIKNKKPDRREFLRGSLVTLPDGTVGVQDFGRSGSGLISSLRQSDGLIEIDEATTRLNQGEMVNFIPFAQFT
ncbi:MAG: gephyrin-like molybdotransferase Glp [Pseudomonadota bacterium]